LVTKKILAATAVFLGIFGENTGEESIASLYFNQGAK
jgi:hypothetical protein